MSEPHIEYECPVCGEWVAILPTTPELFPCPWCKEPLQISSDAEFEGGMWHDLTRLISTRPHMEKMLEHAKSKEPNGN